MIIPAKTITTPERITPDCKHSICWIAFVSVPEEVTSLLKDRQIHCLIEMPNPAVAEAPKPKAVYYWVSCQRWEKESGRVYGACNHRHKTQQTASECAVVVGRKNVCEIEEVAE